MEKPEDHSSGFGADLRQSLYFPDLTRLSAGGCVSAEMTH